MIGSPGGSRAAPTRVQLWFNERLEHAFSQLSVRGQQGTQVDLKDVQVGPDDPKRFSISLPPLEPGASTW